MFISENLKKCVEKKNILCKIFVQLSPVWGTFHKSKICLFYLFIILIYIYIKKKIGLIFFFSVNEHNFSFFLVGHCALHASVGFFFSP